MDNEDDNFEFVFRVFYFIGLFLMLIPILRERLENLGVNIIYADFMFFIGGSLVLSYFIYLFYTRDLKGRLMMASTLISIIFFVVPLILLFSRIWSVYFNSNFVWFLILLIIFVPIMAFSSVITSLIIFKKLANYFDVEV